MKEPFRTEGVEYTIETANWRDAVLHPALNISLAIAPSRLFQFPWVSSTLS